MSASLEPEIEIREAHSAHVILKYPDLLRTLDFEPSTGIDLVLAAAEEDLVFRPNLVVTSTPSTAPLIDASVSAILAADSQQPGAQFLGVDVFYPAAAGVEDGPVGRIISFVYPTQNNLAVLVKKWVIATGDVHVHLTASFLPSQALAVEETFDWIAAHCILTGDPRALRSAAIGASQAEVRLDVEASDRAGFPLEDLSVLPAPLPESAPAVSIAAVELVMGAQGVSLEAPKVLSVILNRAGERGFYHAYSAPDGMLVVRSSGASAHGMDATQAEVYRISPERLPADATAWIGVTPAFRFSDVRSISAEEYASRFDGSGQDAPWIEFRIEMQGTWWVAVFIADQGFFEAISPTEEVIELHALPAARFWDLVIRRIDSVLGGVSA